VETLSFARRFRGFDHGALGGYAAGSVAKRIGGCVEVNVRSLPPMERELALRQDGAGLDLYDGDTLVLEAHPVAFELALPPFDLDAAEQAGQQLIHDQVEHAYPECFACGPGRNAGDGLRVFLGSTGRADGVIGNTWTPDPRLADTEDLPVEMVWSALDCPTIWAAGAPEPGTFPVLARQRVEIRAPVRLGQVAVVAAWPIDRDGRKRLGGAAIYDATGELLARCEALLVLVPTPA
jgi:hypothetical protein